MTKFIQSGPTQAEPANDSQVTLKGQEVPTTTTGEKEDDVKTEDYLDIHWTFSGAQSFCGWAWT